MLFLPITVRILIFRGCHLANSFQVLSPCTNYGTVVMDSNFNETSFNKNYNELY